MINERWRLRNRVVMIGLYHPSIESEAFIGGFGLRKNDNKSDMKMVSGESGYLLWIPLKNIPLLLIIIMMMKRT
jgi:hypothetical protein